MRVTINLTKKEIEHIYPNHTFYDCCIQVKTIMKRIQDECGKNLKKKWKTK